MPEMSLPIPESPTEEWLVQALSEVLDREVIECSFERIGAAFGLAGETYAVTTGAASDAVRVAAKFERSEHTARAAWFLRGLGEVGVVPELMGAWFDDERGVLMTRLVEPAEQGDVLAGCSPKQARAVLRAIAEIHARNWGARLEHRFPGSLWETRRWRDRVATASARVPSLFDDEMTHWLLEEFPPALEAALGRLESSPQTGIQLDAHLDNVLWREDGSAVIVDWANACEGPPAVDLAGLAIGGLGTLRIHPYREELLRRGVGADEADAAIGRLPDACFSLAQGMVGWVGRTDVPEPDPGSRVAQLRDTDVRRVLRMVRSRGR